VVDTRQIEAAGSTRLERLATAHIFRPERYEGAIAGAAVGGLASLLGVSLLVRGAFRGVTFATFGGDVLGLALLLLGAQCLYWAYAIYNLRYIVDDDSLTITWGLTQVLIPVDQIQRIVLGQKYGEPHVRGISWPGCHVGWAKVGRLGLVLFYSAHRSAADLVYVSTTDTTFGLSLTDPRGLARAIQVAQEGAYDSSGQPVASYRVFPELGILRDRDALLLVGAAVVAFLLAAGYIYARYQSLPLSLPLGYPPSAGPQRIGERGELLRLPLTALVWLVIGFALAAWARPRFRTVCYSLLAGTVFVECLYAVAALAAAH
jgi:hypothetical protein